MPANPAIGISSRLPLAPMATLATNPPTVISTPSKITAFHFLLVRSVTTGFRAPLLLVYLPIGSPLTYPYRLLTSTRDTGRRVMQSDRNIVPVGRIVTQPHLIRLLEAASSAEPRLVDALARRLQRHETTHQPALRLVYPPEAMR